MHIVVDELLTNYTLTGKGKLILLLHGWGDTSRGLAGLQKALSLQFQVLSVDLPGFGVTEPPRTTWDLDNYGSFAKALLDKLGLGQPYVVIGHSNGGAIAIRALATGTLQSHKLVLIAAAGIRSTASARRGSLKVVAKTGKAATFWMPERYRKRLRGKLYGAVGSDMLVVPQLEETFKKTVRQDVQADAAKLSVPTLLLFAEKDQAVPLSNGYTYHQLIKGSKLDIIPGAGHFVHLDEAELITTKIEEFLK